MDRMKPESGQRPHISTEKSDWWQSYSFVLGAIGSPALAILADGTAMWAIWWSLTVICIGGVILHSWRARKR